MQQNLLLTAELKETLPDTIEILHNFGKIEVVFPPLEESEEGEEPMIMVGDNAVLEGEMDEFIKWLRPFDGIAVNRTGVPQLEQFTIMHIKDDV